MSNTEESKQETPHKPQPEQHVEVAVVTTSGTWPKTGYDQVPIHQKVKIQLKEAARNLHITDTTGWIATVNGQEINVEASYLENGLKGQINIDYGPKEGGGGNERGSISGVI